MRRVAWMVLNSNQWTDHLVPFLKQKYNTFAYDVWKYIPNADRYILYGDHNLMPLWKFDGKDVYVMTDTPLIDCNLSPRQRNEFVFVPSSTFDKEILENCNAKNITEVVYKPIRYIEGLSDTKKKYDILFNITQPERKGAERIPNILKKLDEMGYNVTVYVKVPKQIVPLIPTSLKNVRVYVDTNKHTYEEWMKIATSARINAFTSYVEGIGIPPIESALYKQQLVMGDIDASREFVNAKFARIVDVKVSKINQVGMYSLFQIWDYDEFVELLIKAIEDEKFNVPTLKVDVSYDGVKRKIDEVVLDGIETEAVMT